MFRPFHLGDRVKFFNAGPEQPHGTVWGLGRDNEVWVMFEGYSSPTMLFAGQLEHVRPWAWSEAIKELQND